MLQSSYSTVLGILVFRIVGFRVELDYRRSKQVVSAFVCSGIHSSSLGTALLVSIYNHLNCINPSCLLHSLFA